MVMVNIHEAKTKFSSLIKRALSGEEIIIAKDGTPIIKLTPYTAEMPKRIPGLLKGIMYVADDFDDPLPKELLDQFYKKDI
jgi:prevent-host-death family protein